MEEIKEEPELNQDTNELGELGPNELATEEDLDLSKLPPGSTLIDQHQPGLESLSIKLTNGAEVCLSSSKLLINELCGLALDMIKKLKTNKKNGLGDYLG